MAKTKKKRLQEARDKKDAQKFWQVVGIGTIILLFLLYLLFRNVP